MSNLSKILSEYGVDVPTFSEEKQLEAVKQNGNAIAYINNPSEKVQFQAVKQNGYAIQYIHNPSEKLQLEAVKQDGGAIQYIHNPSEKVQLEAVKQDGYVIQFIHNPSEKLQLVFINSILKIKNFNIQENIFLLIKLSDNMLERLLKGLTIKDVIE